MAATLQQKLLVAAEEGSSPGEKGSSTAPAAFQGFLRPRQLFLGLMVGLSLICIVAYRSTNESVARPQVADMVSVVKPFECYRDGSKSLVAQTVEFAERKGLAVDDTTWDSCPGSIPISWPATNGGEKNRIATLRIFRSISKLKDGVHMLKKFLVLNSARVLLGTPITCNQDDDDAEWSNTVAALRILGPERVLAVAIGNELDLLPSHPNNCSGNVWGYFKSNFARRVHELKYLEGGAFANTSVATVMAGSILKCGDYGCTPQNMSIIPGFKEVLKFIYDEVPADKFVLSINYYPYFQPCPPLLGDKITAALSCPDWLHLASCLDHEKCVVRQSLAATRLALQSVLGEKGRNARLWVGEVGWSSPSSSTLGVGACGVNVTGEPREICPSWSSAQNLAASYHSFLKWDLEVGPGFRPVEMAFWFSIRDSINFGKKEYFGLCGLVQRKHEKAPCKNKTAKVCGGDCEFYDF